MSGERHGLADALAVARLRGRGWAPIVEDARRTDVLALDAAASEVAAELARRGVAAGARVGFA
ncbi:MAG: hypothetical protein AB1689_24205, partial [Thermodesulfobacteriota bacterium]